MTQPFLVFPTTGMPAFGGTINPAKLNKGDRMYTLCSAFGALGSFVPAAGSTFATNFPAWGPFATAQGVQAIAGPGGRMSLWVDPTSSSYVLVLNSLLTAGALPTSLAALGEDMPDPVSAPKAKAAGHSREHGKEHGKHSWSKEDIRHEDEPEDDKPRSRR